MTIMSKIGTREAIIEVCRQHLSQKAVDKYAKFLSPWWFLDTDHVHVVGKGQQTAAIKEIERSLRKALLAYNSLHTDVKRAVEWQVTHNIKADNPMTRLQPFSKIDGVDTPIHSNDNLELLLRTAFSSFLGQSTDANSLEILRAKQGNSASSAAEEALSDLNMKEMTKQAKGGQSWQKALTVKRCRELWLEAHEVEAPISLSGQFAKFLGDMVDALGKRDEWKSLPNVMAAWRARAQNDEWFL